jgi:hypothetical protein
MKLPTKDEAHEKFLRWIEQHPSDEWLVVGGENGANGYSGIATKKTEAEFRFDDCIFRYRMD